MVCLVISCHEAIAEIRVFLPCHVLCYVVTGNLLNISIPCMDFILVEVVRKYSNLYKDK